MKNKPENENIFAVREYKINGRQIKSRFTNKAMFNSNR